MRFANNEHVFLGLILLLAFSLLTIVLLGGQSTFGGKDASAAEQGAEANIRGIEIIHLSDGTRCVLFRDGRQGGIDCDWQSTPCVKTDSFCSKRHIDAQTQ